MISFKRCDICKSKLYSDSDYCKDCNNCCCTCEDEETLKLVNFFRALEHGDDKHRLWLKEEFEKFWDIDVGDITPSGKEATCTRVERYEKALTRIKTAGSRQLARQFATEALRGPT